MAVASLRQALLPFTVLHVGHPEYLWLNRLQCVGVGVFDVAQSRVSYDIYAMR
jgi:hypothetical protein